MANPQASTNYNKEHPIVSFRINRKDKGLLEKVAHESEMDISEFVRGIILAAVSSLTEDDDELNNKDDDSSSCPRYGTCPATGRKRKKG